MDCRGPLSACALAIFTRRHDARHMTAAAATPVNCGLYESEQELARREAAPRKLETVVQEYVRREGLNHTSEPEAAS
ncbi:hypothetical protein BBJ28_00009999 [Nothophytophthora sp. Chile5]|nr:hypothetical protein BBJ28_00009999 [Nothophytophthora sp. Chile5]